MELFVDQWFHASYYFGVVKTLSCRFSISTDWAVVRDYLSDLVCSAPVLPRFIIFCVILLVYRDEKIICHTCDVARWQAQQTDIIVQWQQTIIDWAVHWAPSVWRIPVEPMRSRSWRAWAHCRWTVQRAPAEHWVPRLCCLRTRAAYTPSVAPGWPTSTLPRLTWSSMTWTLHSHSCRPKRPSTTWAFMHSDCRHLFDSPSLAVGFHIARKI